MSNICILTDSTAQFIHPNFPGREQVHVIPLEVTTESGAGTAADPSNNKATRLNPPKPADITDLYSQLSHTYNTILVLTLSGALSPATVQAIEATRQYSNHATVEIIDSLTTGLGLGYLVQTAAKAVSEGASLAEVEHQIRGTIPRIYTLLCIPELTYLARSGYMEYSQALVGEMMGMLPIFAMEEGRLVPQEKVRTQRHLFEAFQEFMNEFESPAHIALVRGANRNVIRSRPMHQYVRELFPETPYSEHIIPPPLMALFGSQSTSLVIIE